MRHLFLAGLQNAMTGLFLICLAMAPIAGYAQPYSSVTYSQPELEQLVAPVALYPDQLLSQVLSAAVYPQDVVDAEQFLQTNSFVSANAMADEVALEPWNPSAKFLTQFPDVLAMMNDNLDWTQRLGDAFYYQQGDVMSGVQVLRRRALDEGTLASNQQIVVTVDSGDYIIIAARSPNRIYVPYYNPSVVYGTWGQPDYPPVVFEPPPAYQQTYYSPVIAFAVGVVIINNLFFPIVPDWHHHYLRHERWNNHPNWPSNTTWQPNRQRRQLALIRDPLPQWQKQRQSVTPLQRAMSNRTVQQRGATNNQLLQPSLQPNRAPLPGQAPQPNRAPLLQPNRTQVTPPNNIPLIPTNRASQPNQAPLLQPNRAPAPQPGLAPQPNRVPLIQPNRAPLVQPEFTRGGEQVRSPESRPSVIPPMAPRPQPNAEWVRPALPAAPSANVMHGERRAPVIPQPDRPNFNAPRGAQPGVPQGASPAQPSRPTPQERTTFFRRSER